MKSDILKIETEVNCNNPLNHKTPIFNETSIDTLTVPIQVQLLLRGEHLQRLAEKFGYHG